MTPRNPFVEGAETPWTRKGILARRQCPDCRPSAQKSSGAHSELQACLKRDHAWTAIATQADAQQAGWGRSCVRERAKSRLRGRLSWNPRQRHAGKPKVWMVEYIEELGFYSKFHSLANRKPFREIEVIPDKIGAAQGVAAEVSELAMLWVVATGALPSAGINGGNKRGRIEPLEGARLGNTSDRMMLIERDARNDARELRSAALHNAVSVGRVRRAQDREWNSAMPEHGSGDLPAVERL